MIEDIVDINKNDREDFSDFEVDETAMDSKNQKGNTSSREKR